MKALRKFMLPDEDLEGEAFTVVPRSPAGASLRADRVNVMPEEAIVGRADSEPLGFELEPLVRRAPGGASPRAQALQAVLGARPPAEDDGGAAIGREFDEEDESARRDRLMAAIARGGQTIGAAMLHQKADTDFADQVYGDAQKRLDAASPKARREALRQYLLEKRKMGFEDQDRARASVLAGREDADYAAKQASAAADRDPNSEASKSLRSAVAQLSPKLAQMPGFGTMSAAQLRNALPTLTKAAEQQFDAQQKSLDRASAEKRARIGASAAQQKQESVAVVPGLDVAPGARPTQDDAKKMKSSLASADRMRRYVTELRALHAKHGTELGGEVATRMGQLVKQIQLEGKNIAELGAISGPDLALMEGITGADPTSWGANAKAIVGIDNTQAALDGLDKWLGDQVGANKTAYGYQDKPGARPATGPRPTGKTKTDRAGVVWEEMSDGTARRRG